MSSLKTVTLDVSGWSNEKMCEFLDWLEMFEDHQPGKETCYSLKEEFATGSEDLNTSETLEELKETQQDLLQIKEWRILFTIAEGAGSRHHRVAQLDAGNVDSKVRFLLLSLLRCHQAHPPQSVLFCPRAVQSRCSALKTGPTLQVQR